MENKKHQKNVLKKLRLFFEKVKKAKYFKVSNQLDAKWIAEMIKIEAIKIAKFKGKNISIMMGDDGDDFVKDQKTVRISFFHAKQDRRL